MAVSLDKSWWVFLQPDLHNARSSPVVYLNYGCLSADFGWSVCCNYENKDWHVQDGMSIPLDLWLGWHQRNSIPSPPLVEGGKVVFFCPSLSPNFWMTFCIVLWNHVNWIVLVTATALHECNTSSHVSVALFFRCSKRATILHLDLALKIFGPFPRPAPLLGWKDYVDWLPSDCVQQSSKCRGLGWLTATLGVLDPLKDCGVGYFLCWFGLLGDGFIRPTLSSTKGSGKSWSWAFIS